MSYLTLLLELISRIKFLTIHSITHYIQLTPVVEFNDSSFSKFLKIIQSLSLVPRPREEGEKVAWYQLHAHALKHGVPNMTVYFPYSSPVYVRKLLRIFQTKKVKVSESIDLYVSSSPKDDATRKSSFPKCTKVAGPCLKAHLPNTDNFATE